MENASKALIIAGAILISILLISVGILVFNSTKGVTDNAGNAGDVMMTAAAEENAKIVLSTMDIENDAAFNEYITSKYKNKTLTAKEVMELCTLVVERSKQLTGEGYFVTETHITGVSNDDTIVVYWSSSEHKLKFRNFDTNKKYKATFSPWEAEYDGNYSIAIRESI